jgi:hypothetical protein
MKGVACFAGRDRRAYSIGIVLSLVTLGPEHPPQICDMQEGCHFDLVSQNLLLPILADALEKEGMSDVQIAASDETSAFLLL